MFIRYFKQVSVVQKNEVESIWGSEALTWSRRGQRKVLEKKTAQTQTLESNMDYDYLNNNN